MYKKLILYHGTLAYDYYFHLTQCLYDSPSYFKEYDGIMFKNMALLWDHIQKIKRGNTKVLF